jgi:hypothetical protein
MGTHHHPEIEALVRDLERLEQSGGSGPATERALTLARMAVDRARRALDGAPDGSRPPSRMAPAAGEPPAPHANRRANFELDSEIPEAHPDKAAIETSVAGAFAGVKGRWRVAILVQPNAPWWGLRVEGASICWTGTLEGPDEQSPEFLSGRVREAVQLGLMQAAIPPRRGRG